MSKTTLFALLAILQLVNCFFVTRDRDYWRTQAKKELEAATIAHSQVYSELVDCQNSNYDLTQKAKYNLDQTQYVIDRGQALIKRLLTTTDVAEYEMECLDDLKNHKDCITGVPVRKFLKMNRKANF